MKFISVMELQFEVVLVFYSTDAYYDVDYEENVMEVLQMWMKCGSYRVLLHVCRKALLKVLAKALAMALPKVLSMALPLMACPKASLMAYPKDS
jgi:hypothetical protein